MTKFQRRALDRMGSELLQKKAEHEAAALIMEADGYDVEA